MTCRSGKGAPPPSPALGRDALGVGRGLERLPDVGQDIVDMLDADRQAQVARRHAGGALVLGAELLVRRGRRVDRRSEEHTSELQSLMRISYAVFCLKKKNKIHIRKTTREITHR